MTKRRDLERELLRAGFAYVRGSGRGGHDKLVRGKTILSLPRHRELNDRLAAQIRREAGLR